MSRTSPHSAFPHHWPIHLTGPRTLGLQGSNTQRPMPWVAPAARGEVPPAAPRPSNGQLTASPWLGLHYETEDM